MEGVGKAYARCWEVVRDSLVMTDWYSELPFTVHVRVFLSPFGSSMITAAAPYDEARLNPTL